MKRARMREKGKGEGNPTRPPPQGRRKGEEAGAREMSRTHGTKKGTRTRAYLFLYPPNLADARGANQRPRDFLISGMRASASAVQRS